MRGGVKNPLQTLSRSKLSFFVRHSLFGIGNQLIKKLAQSGAAKLVASGWCGQRHFLAPVAALNLVACQAQVNVATPVESISVSIRNIVQDRGALVSDAGSGRLMHLNQLFVGGGVEAVTHRYNGSAKIALASILRAAGSNLPVLLVALNGESMSDTRHNEPSNQSDSSDAQSNYDWCLHFSIVLVLAFFAGGGIRMITDALMTPNRAGVTPIPSQSTLLCTLR